MTVENVMSWIKTLDVPALHYYAGTLVTKQEYSIGVYSLKERRNREMAIGGLSCTKSKTKGISILVHWNRSTRETEAAAKQLYDCIAAVNEVTIDGHKVHYFELRHNEPIDVGADENGIQERVIELIIHYEA